MMKKVIEFIKWPLTFPVWAMVALYLFWILSVPIEFVDLEAYILGVIILCIYLVATILIKTFYKREYLSIGLWILLVPLMLVSTLVTLWFVFESIKYFDLLSRGNREFTSYVLGMLVLSIYPAKMLFRKNDAKNRMMQFLLGLNILLFLSGNLLYYVFFHPATLEKAILGNYRYVVADEFDLDFHSHLRFYKCERWSYSCETLYTSNWFLGEPKIIVDEKENEVSLMGGERILYTDGKIRRTYRNTEEQLNNKLYLVAENYKCNNVEYLECIMTPKN
ncbi:MAG: hypothetical protein HN916_15910 [Anaerolineae bacterium]|nr:hypothetical protein [Anaerolineae bacterium]MBT7991927.1 hypothetical protein [Anaerolineae bacterium]